MNHQPNHQSPNAMAVARQAIQTAASESVMAKAFEWGKRNADVMAWIDVNMGTEFADSLAASLNKYGSLTENQCRAVRSKLNVAPAPEITVAAIEATFEKAKSHGVKKPMIRLDTFVFKPAGENSANAGGIYVTEKQADGESVYLGKVLGGKFLRVRSCTDAQQARIVEAAADPVKAAEAYGRRYGACSICGRTLTKEESIDRFIGPICAEKYGM